MIVLADGDSSHPLGGADDATSCRPPAARRGSALAFFFARTAFAAGLVVLACWLLAFFVLVLLALGALVVESLALLLLALLFLALPVGAVLFAAGAFLVVLGLVVLGLAVLGLVGLLLLSPALVALVFVAVVLVDRGVADPADVALFVVSPCPAGAAGPAVFRAGDVVPAGAPLVAEVRRFEGCAASFAAVALPAAAFADAADRPAMTTALCPRSGAAAPLKAVRPDRPRVTRGPAENRGAGHFVHPQHARRPA